VKLDPAAASSSQSSKVLHVLRLKGTFVEASRAHGYLLSKEVDGGPLAAIVPRLRRASEEGSVLERQMYQCLVRRMMDSTSAEFVDGAKAFFEGYIEGERAQGRTPMLRPDRADLMLAAAVAIDLENVSDALQHRLFNHEEAELTTEVATDVARAVADMASQCGRAGVDGVKEALRSLLGRYLPFGPLKLGCTGFMASGADGGGGRFVHARNLDADLVRSWNEAPVMFLVEEEGPNGEPRVPYVAPGTAGLFYTGGVGGTNRAGVVTSLYQMYTRKCAVGYPSREDDIAPFLNQRVLREATSVDRALAIAQSTKHFGAWTLQVGDAKTDDILSFELSAGGVDVPPGRRARGTSMPQTNHFLSPVLRDTAYTPALNKHLKPRTVRSAGSAHCRESRTHRRRLCHRARVESRRRPRGVPQLWPHSGEGVRRDVPCHGPQRPTR
jgi:hypothetical protein